MLDIRFIRENAEKVQAATKSKGYDVNIANLLEVDSRKRDLQQRIEALREKRNNISQQMRGGRPSEDLVEQGRSIKTELSELEAEFLEQEETYLRLIKAVPNMPADDVPVGASEDENQVTKTVGEPTRFNFEPRNHAEIAEARRRDDLEV